MAKIKTLAQQLAVGFALAAADRARRDVAVAGPAVDRRRAGARQRLAVPAWQPRHAVRRSAAAAHRVAEPSPTRATIAPCAVTCSPSAPSCCSARSSTPTRRGSASSSPCTASARCMQVKVGDNVGRIEAALRSLLAGADAVIVCGGLGPTHDDVTREAIAAVMGGVELVPDDGRRRPHPGAVRQPRPADGREQPAPGARAGGRDGHRADPWHRTRADLPGRRQGRSTPCPACRTR